MSPQGVMRGTQTSCEVGSGNFRDNPVYYNNLRLHTSDVDELISDNTRHYFVHCFYEDIERKNIVQR